MNMQQLEGLHSFGLRDTYHDEHGVLESATSYTNMLLCIGYNAFLKSPNAVTEHMGLQASYNHQLFAKHVEKWIDPERDKGPFVLVHGDLHLSNLVVDDDAHIIGVLDWEWSGVVPVQYFTPPLWLSGRDTIQLALASSWQLFLKTSMKEFLAIVKTREMEMFGNLQLHSEWSQAVANAEPLVANAIQNWTEVEWFVHRYLNHKQELSSDEQSTFVKDDPSRALLAHIKEHDYEVYSKALIGLESEEATKGEEPVVRTLMERIHNVRQHASMVTNILGWSVAACLVIAAVWRRPTT